MTAVADTRLTRRRFLTALAAGVTRRAWAGSADLATVLEELRARAGLPALAGAAFSSAKTLSEAAVGRRQRTGNVAVTIDDIFHVGSITKSMTAVLAGQWVDTGRLRWDSTLGEVLGDLPLHERVKPVTLWQLLRHRSGLQRDIPDRLYDRLKLSGIAPAEQRLQLARVMLAKPPENTPDAVHEYSNVGYTFAGLMLERTAREPWEQLMTARLFGPLGLKSAGFGAPAKDPAKVDQPWGHLADGTPVEPGPKADNVPAIGPAGTVHMSVRDLARYARWHLRENQPQPPLVAAATLSKLHGAGLPDEYYAGWKRLARDWAGGQALTHNGTNTMFFAVVWLAPARDFGVAAMCNQGGGTAEQTCDAVCAHLIEQHFAG